MTTGQRIKKLRGDDTQEIFAEKIGVSGQHISRMEKDLSLPSVEIGLKICEVFGVTLDWLYTGKEPTKADENAPDKISIPKDKYIELLEAALGNSQAQANRLKNIEGASRTD